jgi:hypothetical protein
LLLLLVVVVIWETSLVIRIVVVLSITGSVIPFRHIFVDDNGYHGWINKEDNPLQRRDRLWITVVPEDRESYITI